MKKILLVLFVSLCGLVSFSYGVNLVGLDGYSYNITPGNYNQENNHFYGKDSVLCISLSDLSDLGVKYIYYRETMVGNNSNFYYSYGQRDISTSRGFVCGMLPGNSQTFYSSIGFDKRGITYTIYQFAGLGGDGSDLAINFVDSYTNNTNKLNFHLDDGDDIGYSIYYNSNNTPITVNNSSSVVNLASRYQDIFCEQHIQFQDISNSTGVKTLSYYFNPFSGANNNSVYYNSQENVVQVDNYYGVAEVISTVPSTPSDCSSCESDLSTCQGNLSSCGTSLSSCNNDLSVCLSGNIGTGEYNWSALFINNIQHLGKPIINITIPEEINRDYTGNENSFDLDIKGYDIDSDYIQGIIDINSYTPTSEEFTETFVGGLTLIIPYIVLSLFILFVWKLLKKIFR